MTLDVETLDTSAGMRPCVGLWYPAETRESFPRIVFLPDRDESRNDRTFNIGDRRVVEKVLDRLAIRASGNSIGLGYNARLSSINPREKNRRRATSDDLVPSRFNEGGFATRKSDEEGGGARVGARWTRTLPPLISTVPSSATRSPE